MDTLLLDRSDWDLCINAAGNIAMASDPYSIIQDVASRCRLFLGELYYDTTQGIPYFTQILGKRPPLQLVKNQLVRAAMMVPGVLSARVFITRFEGRELSGQIQIMTRGGPLVVTFPGPPPPPSIEPPVPFVPPPGPIPTPTIPTLDFSNPANSGYLASVIVYTVNPSLDFSQASNSGYLSSVVL